MRRISILLFTLITFLVAAAWPQSDAPKKEPTIITFDPPGSVLTSSQDINPAGAITGWFFDASNKVHGFLRAKDGTFVTFDSPNAGIGAFQGTVPYSINPAGAITGWVASNSGAHSYVRAPDGTFTTFDVPGGLATQALNINPQGAIAGQFLDPLNYVFHVFLRAKDGTFTTFEAPGAGTGVGQGTQPATIDGLNPEGAVAVAYVNTGSFFSGTQVLHGAVRAPDGTFTEFDVPGAGTGPGQGTNPSGINPAGTIPGFYIDSSGVNHGFVRAKDGTITTVDVPGAGTGAGQGTVVASINAPGNFDGWYIDGSGVAHGFLRSKQGDITTFDVPGAGTASGQGTFPIQNNPADAITGNYIDASGVLHGFLRK